MECEVHIDGIHLEHVSEFRYLGWVLDKSRYRWGKIYESVSVIGSLVNARELQIECASLA